MPKQMSFSVTFHLLFLPDFDPYKVITSIMSVMVSPGDQQLDHRQVQQSLSLTLNQARKLVYLVYYS